MYILLLYKVYSIHILYIYFSVNCSLTSFIVNVRNKDKSEIQASTSDYNRLGKFRPILPLDMQVLKRKQMKK